MDHLEENWVFQWISISIFGYFLIIEKNLTSLANLRIGIIFRSSSVSDLFWPKRPQRWLQAVFDIDTKSVAQTMAHKVGQKIIPGSFSPQTHSLLVFGIPYPWAFLWSTPEQMSRRLRFCRQWQPIFWSSLHHLLYLKNVIHFTLDFFGRIVSDWLPVSFLPSVYCILWSITAG